MSTVRVPTPVMISRLLKNGFTQAENAELFSSFDAAFEAIRQLDAQRWLKPASEASVAKAQSLGAQLGWIPRDYAGAPQIFKSMQIDLCSALDRMDSAPEGPAKAVAREALVARLREFLTRPVQGSDQRQRGRVEPVRAQIPAPAQVPAADEAPF